MYGHVLLLFCSFTLSFSIVSYYSSFQLIKISTFGICCTSLTFGDFLCEKSVLYTHKKMVYLILEISRNYWVIYRCFLCCSCTSNNKPLGLPKPNYQCIRCRIFFLCVKTVSSMVANMVIVLNPRYTNLLQYSVLPIPGNIMKICFLLSDFSVIHILYETLEILPLHKDLWIISGRSKLCLFQSVE